MRVTAVLAIALACLGAVTASDAPIIGVLTAGPDGGQCDTVTRWLFETYPDRYQAAPEDVTGDHGCFQAAYVKWIESGGARVVPIPFDSSNAELDFLFESVNGILFTGGGLTLDLNTTYYQTANYLFNKVKAANDAGDYFPLWGTCMGFQLLNILAAADHSVLTENAFDSENISFPLFFTPESRASRLYNGAGSDGNNIWGTLTNENCTINFHHDGVQPSVFNQTPKLYNFYNVLSTNFDRKGLEFVSSIEAKNYPIYGVQYHPERVQFEYWGPLNPSAIDHSATSIQVGQYLANFLVSEARKSSHAFPPATEDSYLIYHYTPIYLGEGQLGYFF